ncbi:hypothetical protein B0T24DRAFT_319892 [Lasiosphaeria ovina]|uniref:Uncharacterized protein n=1 Tax=Lasiosphaeria ovina TaxID=92902 RepID=A0AAE0N601_9PEZI|nr:hypothetical protein B0T24DRAFT_319892 [Lasiosphaeria ovina]
MRLVGSRKCATRLALQPERGSRSSAGSKTSEKLPQTVREERTRMIVGSQCRALPHCPAGCRSEEPTAQGRRVAKRMPGVSCRAHSFPPPNISRAIHGDQSARLQSPILTSGLGPEALTMWTHGTGTLPTPNQKDEGCLELSPPVGPRRCPGRPRVSPLFSGPRVPPSLESGRKRTV